MICNKFKPERCHHCSTCGRCVLVMDHHCPWLNNCVGFKNRKFFMLLLVYSTVMVCLMIPFTIWPLIHIVQRLKKTRYLIKLIFGLIGLVLEITFLVIMRMFISYHCDLIDKNMTTIDHLDIKRGRTKDYNFDFGKDWNWKSIFGQNKICWYAPLNTGE